MSRWKVQVRNNATRNWKLSSAHENFEALNFLVPALFLLSFAKLSFCYGAKKRDVDDFNSSKYLQTFALKRKKLGRKMAGNLNSEALNIQEMHSQIYFWREFCSLSLKWIIETHIVESQFGYSVKKCLTAMITKPMQLSLDATK